MPGLPSICPAIERLSRSRCLGRAFVSFPEIDDFLRFPIYALLVGVNLDDISDSYGVTFLQAHILKLSVGSRVSAVFLGGPKSVTAFVVSQKTYLAVLLFDTLDSDCVV